jgi:S1-C subfamily serine protease
MFETVLLATSKVATFVDGRPLTTGSGFFFERDGRLFLVTSRHVFIDEPSQHMPNRVEVRLHVDADNLAECADFSIPLYRDGRSAWRQGEDSAGPIDVAAIEINCDALPPSVVYRAFTPQHICHPGVAAHPVEIGSPLLILGFPLGFHDTLHHIPVARQAIVASSFDFRFEGRGYFLTDARTHRGTSGSPVIMRDMSRDTALGDLPWLLLGIHSARLDMATRDIGADEALGLNCAWYADILMTLTDGGVGAS